MHSRLKAVQSPVDHLSSHLSSIFRYRGESGRQTLDSFSKYLLKRLSQKFNRKIAERTFIYQVVGNATFSVDTFFFISGLLVVLLFLRTEKVKRKKNGADVKTDFWCNSLSQSCIMVFYRFLRLTPIYIIIIAFTELALKWVNQNLFGPTLLKIIFQQNGLQRFRVHTWPVRPHHVQQVLVAQHFVHQQFLPAQPNLSDVVVVSVERFPVLHRRNHLVDFVNEVGNKLLDCSQD